MPRAPSAGRGFFREPLTTILGSPGAVLVLRVLSRHGGILAVPTLERATGLTNAGAHRVLRALAETGIVRAEGQGRVTAYRLDRDHPLAASLARVFADEEARVGRVLDAVRAAAAPYRPRAVWLFGSAARGNDESGSDVDVAVAFRAGTPEAALESVRLALRPAESAERVAVSIIGLWPGDIERLAGGRAGGDPLWRALERDAIPLLGPTPAMLRAADKPARHKGTPQRRRRTTARP